MWNVHGGVFLQFLSGFSTKTFSFPRTSTWERKLVSSFHLRLWECSGSPLPDTRYFFTENVQLDLMKILVPK
jgi:hypothetical protein